MKRATRHAVAIAACTFQVDKARTNEIQLTPAGTFRARDGRPAGVPGWQLDAALAARVIADAKARKTPFVIDYEHQTLHAEQNGQPAPAAGFFSELAWREGVGLFATDVRWTDRAAGMIAAGEYQFISPVLRYDQKTGAVLKLEMAALTNFPAIDGLQELELRAAAKYSPDDEDHTMNPILIALLTALGLSESATQSEATAALKALQDQVAAKDTEIVALKTRAPDPAKYVSIDVVEALKADIAALKATDQGREVEDLVKVGLAEGRILPAMEQWARDLGKSDLAALKSYIEKAAPIAALAGTQTRGKAPDGTSAAGKPGDAELAVCKQLGISAEDFAKANAAA